MNKDERVEALRKALLHVCGSPKGSWAREIANDALDADSKAAAEAGGPAEADPANIELRLGALETWVDCIAADVVKLRRPAQTATEAPEATEPDPIMAIVGARGLLRDNLQHALGLIQLVRHTPEAKDRQAHLKAIEKEIQEVLDKCLAN